MTARRHAFTLLEMLLATALATLLIAGVLAMLVGVSRDRRRLASSVAAPAGQEFIEQLRRDLINAGTIAQDRDGRTLVLIGNGGIDRRSLAGNGRFARITYRRLSDASASCLLREQEYLDDPVRPDRWAELVAVGVNGIRVIPESTDAWPVDAGAETTGVVGATTTIPSRVRLHLDMPGGAINEELSVR